MLSKYSPYLLCLLISILVVVLYINDFSPLVRLEWKLQDMLYSFRGETNFSNDIILVDIDNNACIKYGSWPWDRDRLADLLAAVGNGQPRTVLLDIVLDQNTEQDTLNYTHILAGQMSWMQNVIVPYEITTAEFRNNKLSVPGNLKHYSMRVNSDIGLLEEDMAVLGRKLFFPPEEICTYAAGLGFKHERYDSDRKIRWASLLMHYEGYYYPSLTLMAAAHYFGINASDINVFGGESISMAGIEIPTNYNGEMFINYNKPGESYCRVSAVDILDEAVGPETFKDKLVIVSVTDDADVEYYATPVTKRLQGSEKTANIMENILHTNFIKRYDADPEFDLILLFGIGILFAFILPRVSLLYRVVILLIAMFILANVSFILFNSLKIIIRSLYFGLEFFLLLLASPLLDHEFLAALGLSGDSQDGLKKSGLPKIEPNDLEQSKSRTVKPRRPARRPEPAPDKPPADVATKATDVNATDMATVKAEIPGESYQETATYESTSAEKAAPPTPEMPATTSPPPDAPPEASPEAPSEDAAEPVLSEDEAAFDESEYDDPHSVTPATSRIKKLGRYKVLGIVGKGAMGTVYKGTDPAINRNVALKTIRLDFVSDPEELAELKERLSAEARAAGMLSHPNIVTIYDVGSERNLQYIAMEFLEGQTLESMIRRKVKFNYRIISQIISQICSALDFAHRQKIVHRDIKPANIMVLKDYTIKVMDFGIARVDSSSMTRTGIAMGTPNYISPEQLQGKQVDIRCDIFSLGVVMYELLVNKRPFSGENLTALIYNIVNKEPEPPSKVDSSIPPLFDRVISKALKKDPNERYQRATEVTTDLADFIESFAGRRSASV